MKNVYVILQVDCDDTISIVKVVDNENKAEEYVNSFYIYKLLRSMYQDNEKFWSVIKIKYNLSKEDYAELEQRFSRVSLCYYEETQYEEDM